MTNEPLAWLIALGLFACSTSLTAITIVEDVQQRSREYVRNLDTDCTLTDGYRCLEVVEDRFMKPESWDEMLPAVYLRAWMTAFEDFQRIPDLTDEQKGLKHYRVGLTENDTQFIVYLQGLALPVIDDAGNPSGITTAVFGRSAKYWIDKQSNQIVKRIFYK